MKHLTLILTSLLAASAAVVPPPRQKLQRLPLQKSHLTFNSPPKYEKRISRYDTKTGQPVYYDPKPKVQLLDAKSGKYAFKWIGYDGREKNIIFQRADAIDTIVSASVSRTAAGQYLYTYNITNLPSSGSNLSGFAVQTFTPSLSPIGVDNVHIGRMSNNRQMAHGNWIRFAPLSSFKPSVVPGRVVEFKLISPAPPGLVECRVHGGELGLRGVGEDMPQELENILPSYEDWPRGYTVGPNSNLASSSISDRLEDVLLWLPQFKKLGWITPASCGWYKQNLNPNNLELVHKHAEQDLSAGNITTEVYAILQAIR
ncbi:MAG: hypothetical protein ABR554_01215 [Pyrinomonadaceae bacterium]